MKAPITIIIPTGDRHKCMELCLAMLASQTITPAQVIVVDDGINQDETTALSRQVTDYIRRDPGLQDPPHTLPVNILEALKVVNQQSIIFMEDDEWYHSEYLESLWTELQKGQAIAGQENSLYYRWPSRTYRYQQNWSHASLCATGLREVLFPALELSCRTCIDMGTGLVDMQLWSIGRRFNHSLIKGNYHVGMKGLPGRRGLTAGWRGTCNGDGYEHDPDLSFLQSIIGNDVEFYKEGADLWHE